MIPIVSAICTARTFSREVRRVSPTWLWRVDECLSRQLRGLDSTNVLKSVHRSAKTGRGAATILVSAEKKSKTSFEDHHTMVLICITFYRETLPENPLLRFSVPLRLRLDQWSRVGKDIICGRKSLLPVQENGDHSSHQWQELRTNRSLTASGWLQFPSSHLTMMVRSWLTWQSTERSGKNRDGNARRKDCAKFVQKARYYTRLETMNRG